MIICFKITINHSKTDTYFNQQRPNPLPVSRNAANVAAVVVRVVLSPVSLGGGCPLRFVPPPLADQAVVAKGAHQRRSVVAQLFRVRRTDMFQQRRKVRRVSS